MAFENNNTKSTVDDVSQEIQRLIAKRQQMASIVPQLIEDLKYGA